MSELVKGEAFESDEELSGNVSAPLEFKGTALAVFGEAPESDEEIFCKELDKDIIKEVNKLTYLQTKDSLLQKKLIETNLSLWNHLNGLVRKTILTTSKQLLNVDELLLKSQRTMQSTLTTLKTIRPTSKQLLEKANNTFTADFFPKINIK